MYVCVFNVIVDADVRSFKERQGDITVNSGLYQRGVIPRTCLFTVRRRESRDPTSARHQPTAADVRWTRRLGDVDVQGCHVVQYRYTTNVAT